MQIVSRYVALIVVAFFLHLTWEKLHIPLYEKYEALGTGWRLAIWATGGDVLYTLVITLAVAVISRRIDWFLKPSLKQIALVALLGFAVALFVEYKALYFHTWAYGPEMPIVPMLNVGLSPLLQMTLLTPVALILVSIL